MKKLNKKGNITLYIVFIIMAIVIILITAVFAPMGVLFNVEMYKAGEQILLQANESISDINDTVIRAEIEDMIISAKDSASFNIEVNADIFKYSWVFIVILIAITIFLFSRRMVEYGNVGFI